MSIFTEKEVNPQELAACSINDNVIVSASAGTGKTWTLVKRVMNHILYDNLNIWQILAVTFTEKAALELKDRIRVELIEQHAKCKDTKLAKRLLNCIYLLPLAQFSTIHSLCSVIIQENFSLLDIPPKLYIVEGLKQKKIKKLAWEQVCKHFIENGSGIQQVLDTARWLCNGDILKLFDFIDALDRFMIIQSEPKQQDYQNLCISNYEILVDKTSVLADTLKLDILDALSKFKTKLLLAEKNINALDYYPWFNDWIFTIDQVSQKMSNCTNYSELHNLVKSISLTPQLEKPMRVKSTHPQSNVLINEVKGYFKNLISETFAIEPSRLGDLLVFNKELVTEYFQLWHKWRMEYQALKRLDGVVDFNDLEHYAYNLLSQNDVIRKKYQNQYRAILVDEYQDTNPLQEDILSMLADPDGLDKPPVVFRVGDVKQSIYRFRGAEPNIFNLHVNNTDGIKNKLITLSHNRRSTPNILSAINYIFSILMTEENAETNYSNNHELIPLTDNCKGEDNKAVDLWFIDSTSITEQSESESIEESVQSVEIENDTDDSTLITVEELHQLELEGRMIGMKLKHLVEEVQETIQDKNGVKQQLKYSDCVILMRNMQAASALVRGLETVGVPVYAILRKGFVNSVEVRDALNLLRCIDNPCDDLALVGWLTSPAVGLSIADLTSIVVYTSRISDQPLYLRVIKYCKENENNITEKIDRSNTVLEELRELLHFENPATILHLAMYRSGLIYAAQMSSFANQKLANLKMLLDLAIEFSSDAGVGLRGLLEYYTELTRSDEIGPAPSIGEGENVVRVMSVHQSKGLEFPVVIVAGLSQKFNLTNQKGLVFSHRHGMATKLVDPGFRAHYRWPLVNIIRQHEKQRMLAEELRILYVALTRAKHRLVLSGYCDPIKINKWINSTDMEILDSDLFFDANSEIMWLMAALVQHPQLNEVLSEKLEREFNVNHSLFSKFPNVMNISWSKLQAIEIVKPQLFELEIPEYKPSELKIKLPDSFINDNYPAKMNVTDIIRAGEDEEAEVFYPVSLSEGTNDALRIGTLYHKVFELMPLNLQLEVVDIVRKQIEIIPSTILSQEDKELIDPSLVSAFYKTELGQYILANPHRVKREISLTFAPAESSKYSLASIIQGRLDMLIESSNGNWIILDFKTDQVVNQEKINHYQQQLEVYAEMISSATNKQVEAIYLHFIREGENGTLKLQNRSSELC